MPSPNLSALTTAFVGGASVFGKQVLNWDLRKLGIQVRTNVNTPQAMTKLSAAGAPRPYRKQDDFNEIVFADRVLTAFQSKYDFDFDPEQFRNTYLANLPEMPFEAAAVEQAAKQYLDALIQSTLYLGVRNGAGTGAADICNGWGKIIADEITATNITPVVTGAVTAANAVTQVELVADAVPAWMKSKGFNVLVSWNVLEKYRKHYRTMNGFGFNRNEVGEYKLDGVNAKLIPADFMGNSQRIIATVDDNLVFGTDIEQISVHATPHLNILQVREMMPAGCQIQDLDAIKVNDQA